MAYVDGFVVPVPKDRVEDYRALGAIAREIWLEHGALEYVECFGDDVPKGEVTSFPRAVQLRDDEVLAFSWAIYPSREARDEILQKCMSDPRFKQWENNLPLDGKRMIWGGFKPFVGLDS